MSGSIFFDKNAKPNNYQIKENLGSTGSHWDKIKNYLVESIGDIIEDWKYYNTKSGWILKNMLKKRNLFFFTPFKGYFRITFVFGDKAVAVVEKSDLPEEIKNSLINARKYMEGRGISVEVKKEEDVEIVKKLVEIKVNN